MRRSLQTCALLVFACMSVVHAEQPLGEEFGIAQRSTSWAENLNKPDSDRVPGIDEGAIAVITMKAGPTAGVPFILWSDALSGMSGSGSGRATGASYTARMQAKGGRTLVFKAETADGRTGTASISGVQYDLSKGELFLVSTRGDQPRVAQLRFDPAKFPTGGDLAARLKKIADANEEIGRFWSPAGN